MAEAQAAIVGGHGDPHAEGEVAHHFDDAVQQHDAAEVGMWSFLVTEVLFFSGMFLVYFIYRYRYDVAYEAASRTTNWLIGAVNTGFLLTSSLTMALAVRAAAMRDRRGTSLYIIATMVLGGLFLGVKAYEYSEKYHHHHIPFFGWDFHMDVPAADTPLGQRYYAEESASDLTPEAFGENFERRAAMYFTIYFSMTGLHAFHMVIGIGFMAYLLVQMARTHRVRSTVVEMTGLYWHFVDLIWIFLYPLFYLIALN